MTRTLRALAALLLAFAAVVLLALPAAAAPGDRVEYGDRGGSGIEVDEDGDGVTDGLDIDGDGRWDVADTDGNGTMDEFRTPEGEPGGTVTEAPTVNGCGVTDVGCKAADVISNAASDALAELARAVTETVGNTVKELGTFWVNVPTPNLSTGSVSEWMRGELAFFVGIAALIATFIGAAKMALERRGQPLRELAGALARLVAVNTASLAVIGALLAVGDEFSVYIIDASTNGTDFGQNMTTLLAISALNGIGLIAVIFLGILAFFASIAQIMLLIARSGLLLVVAGVLPLAASMTNTPAGRNWYNRAIGWTAAALLYKPAAAIIYATAFRAAGTNTGGLIDVLTGLFLMVMAVLTLPALMRLAVPIVSTASSGSSGGGAAGTAALVATGGQVVQMRGGGAVRGGGSGPGPAGPSGGSMPGASGPWGRGGPTGGAGIPGPAGPSGGAGAGGAAAAGAGAATGGAATAVITAGQAAVGAARSGAEKATNPGGPEK